MGTYSHTKGDDLLFMCYVFIYKSHEKCTPKLIYRFNKLDTKIYEQQSHWEQTKMKIWCQRSQVENYMLDCSERFK